MRFLTLAILGLLLAAGTATAGPRSSPSASAKASKPHTTRPPAVVHRSVPVRGQVGVTRDARAASASTAIGNRRTARRGKARNRTPTVRWMHGLEAAANVQARECPDGTMATLAHGHDNIVRCMPL
ncbi:hypothetical protein [Siccirubricoccus deserti]|uniref:Secreted protein n=1 Tax=Siccirubricoccus deserti TaxID=2013562 RepID=A0A9X0QV52_9PROT|nr:hypothetical protein [Siccirubricoccus deserti]MBC4014025.1 hypothetical protein [Siccirubricoccus deserti]